ncbi:MAG TPA: hypothetical protein VMT61_10380 [Candidatus Binataceae bacterium]|nr:hypothetical protein [Candidatus Binataceae bacterium]
MSVSTETPPKNIFVSVGRIATDLFWEVAPAAVFFFITFSLLFLIFKLFAADYAIQFSAFSKAAVAGLILGKVVPLLEHTQAGYKFRGYRRVVVVTFKTIVYAFVVLIADTGERLIEAAHHNGGFAAGFQQLIANASFQRFLGTTLLVSLVLGLYLSIQEINNALGGDGTLLRIMCQRRSEAEG